MQVIPHNSKQNTSLWKANKLQIQSTGTFDWEINNYAYKYRRSFQTEIEKTLIQGIKSSRKK